MKEKQTVIECADSGNLLKNRFIGGFIRGKRFPGILQFITLLFFTLVVYVLLFGPKLAHNNFGTALTWILWWPLIPLIFVLVGRLWCAICPFATVNDFVQKFVGLKLRAPIFLKKYGIWIIDAVFIMITWSDHVFGMVESPLNSAVVLLGITTAVVVSGALWERRTWCRYLCFLGGLSSNYSQTGMVALRGTPEKCAKCKTASCYKGTKTIPGCPVFEYPRTMDSNAQCNLCGYCVKSCPNDSLTLKVRVPTKELWSISQPQLAAAFLAIVIMGIVFIQNLTMLEVWKPILAWLETALNTKSFAITFTITFMAVMFVVIGLMAFTSFVAKMINGDSLAKNFTRFGYAIIALDVSGHIAHNLFHLLREGGAIIITGISFFTGAARGDASSRLVSDATIQILQYGLIALGIAGSLYTAYRISRSSYLSKTWITLLPYAVLILLLGAINIVLFSLPMSLRM